MAALSADQRAPIGVLPTGAKLGRYEILGKLAAGGMAIVYVARAHGVAGFERLVAIKVLHSNLAHEDEFIKMFLDEARLAASIRHPNVVPTIDISDSEKSGYFIVMEYIEGDHLGQLLSSANKSGERLPIRVTLRIVGDALGGLGAAHDLRDEHGNKQNLVHRDVSPHNIMVGRDGVARLTDFGVAKAEDRLTHTRDGQVKGKLAYMAPEQAASGTTDTRSDLFSMGVILWECLTGQRLMRAESTAATLHKLLHGEIPKPSTILPELAPLDPVLAKALSRDADQRYPTAEAFARALEDVASSFAGAASLREVSRIVKHHAATKLKRDKKLIDDALKALRPVGIPTQSGVFTDEVSSPTSPSNSEISIVAGSPSIASKVSTVNETMPGTRRATRRTLEVPVSENNNPAPPPPLGAGTQLAESEPTKREGLPILAPPPVALELERAAREAREANDPGDEPVTRNLLGNREPLVNEPPVVLSPLIAEAMLQIEIESAPAPPPAPVTTLEIHPPWSNSPRSNRRMHLAVLALGILALAAVGLWAGNSSQEVVQVQEMGIPIPDSATAVPAALVTTAASATPAPERIPVRATAPVSAKAVEAQPIVPVVPAAVVGAPTSTFTPVRPRAGVRPVTTSSSATAKPTVRRHRDVSKPIPSHLDVIPNPYHD